MSCTVSLELFPPKAMAMDAWADSFRPLLTSAPSFVSVTYGAGGAHTLDDDPTYLALHALRSAYPTLPLAAHVTCVSGSRTALDARIARYWEIGVRHFVVLRGDVPGGGTYVPHPEGYPYAVDLVRALRARYPEAELSVAGYPECHPDAHSEEEDIAYLQAKCAAGATRIITQFCFDTPRLVRWIHRVHASGMTLPIAPGVLPVQSYPQLERFATACGATLPHWLAARAHDLDTHASDRLVYSALIAYEQCRSLIERGTQHIHLYTLNRVQPSHALLSLWGQYPHNTASSGMA